MDIKEIIALIIQERLSFYFKKNNRPGIEQSQKSDEFNAYLDWTASHGGDEQEGIYLFGLHDGIRLMRDIISV